MTSSLIGSDRSTHLKIVLTALLAASAVVIVGLTAHLSDARSDLAGVPPVVVKAGSPVNVTSQTGVVVR